jgi:hypothetical protein
VLVYQQKKVVPPPPPAEFTALPECVTHVVHGLYSPGGLSKYSRQGGEGGEERERFTSPGEMRSKDSPAGLGLKMRLKVTIR